MVNNINFTSVKVFKSDIQKSRNAKGFMPIDVYNSNGLKINRINPRRIKENMENLTMQDVRAELTDNEVMQLDRGNYWQIIANDIVKEAKIAHKLRNGEDAIAPNTILKDDIAPEIDIPYFMQHKR